jgi:hydrogenase expression/formation protein HypE
VRAGDAVLVNGDLGRHGMAIMSAREGLEFESNIQSDSAALSGPVLALIRAGLEVHCLRDCTRGGLTSVVNEIAESSHLTIELEERLIPVREDVRAACEILGLDPFSVACEGRFVVFLPAEQAARAVEILKAASPEAGACRIGSVSANREPRVILKSTLGALRILDMPSGEQLPRIC